MAPISDYFQDPKVAFVTGQQITDALTSIIHEAKKRLNLVSPYHSLRNWQRFKSEITQAKDRGVIIRMYYRSDANSDPATETGYEDGIESIAIDWLHAKVYANESVALVTSMNLHQFSALNSVETGVLIRDYNLLSQIEEWISNLPNSKPNNTGQETAGVQVTDVKAKKGYCIACANLITFNPQQPFCSSAGHSFSTDPGSRCHQCGQSATTNHDNSLCQNCVLESIAQ